MVALIYINPPDSGLGDRLLDIMLLYSFSVLLNCTDFYVHWEYNQSFDHSRQCLKLNNLLHYIKFPENIHFIDKYKDYSLINHLNTDSKNIFFMNTLGAASIFSFNEKYLKNNLDSQKQLEKIYYDSFKKLEFINIPDEIKHTFIYNDVATIHLRRTDKVTSNIYSHGVNTSDLVLLNKKTKEFIESYIIESNTCDKILCIISDDKNVKDEYIYNISNNNQKINILSYNENCQIKQTYYDFYCLCNSNIIFMSQRFSTFSIVASLMVKPKTLYYPFDSGRLFEFDNICYKFYTYPGFNYYV